MPEFSCEGQIARRVQELEGQVPVLIIQRISEGALQLRRRRNGVSQEIGGDRVRRGPEVKHHSRVAQQEQRLPVRRTHRSQQLTVERVVLGGSRTQGRWVRWYLTQAPVLRHQPGGVPKDVSKLMVPFPPDSLAVTNPSVLTAGQAAAAGDGGVSMTGTGASAACSFLTATPQPIPCDLPLMEEGNFPIWMIRSKIRSMASL